MSKHQCLHDVDFALMQQDIKSIKKALEGNGKKGLVDKVKDNSDFVTGFKAQRKLLLYLGGTGWFATIMLYIINFFQ